MFKHQVPSPEALINSYFNQSKSRSARPTKEVPDCFKEHLDKVDSLIRETSYGTLECPTQTAS